MPPQSHELPREPADRFTLPFARFLKIESTTGAFLLFATVVALVLSNSPLADASQELWDTPVGLRIGARDFTRSLRHWINDGLMTLFFFVVALELKREIVHGELRTFRMAAFSFAAALGGMLVPAAVYLVFMRDESGAGGWGTVMSTDTAFVVGALALLGSRIPASLRLFLLSLAIFDDVGAILVVALGYGGAIRWPVVAVVGVLMIVVLTAGRLGIRSVLVYVLLGLGLWLALDASGIHPTLAGVFLGLVTPAREWVSDERLHAIFQRVLAYPKGKHWSGDTADRRDLRRAGVAAREALAPVERLQMALHPWSGFVIMPVFALANAGVQVSWTDFDNPVAVAVFAGLVLGKPVGVLGSSFIAVRIGLATRPQSLKWSIVAAGSLLTGIGFTMSIFIAGLAFGPDELGAAKIGILGASITAGTAGLLLLLLLTSTTKSAPGPAPVPS